ncbi:MAG: FeoB-associated Cys-rich membrane protein [Clostridiales bacterium]|nr:FeoB-associated Cys-rich membrane protein [Clostridiales bacterium]
MNIWDCIILAIVAGGVVLAVISIVRSKKKGGCHGSCSSCPYGDSCTTKDQ